jgi:PKD repeat protein
MSFTDTSTSYDDITLWSWEFGDGGTSSVQNPTREYAQDGTYTVTLTVKEADSDTSTETQSVTVTDKNPVAGFTYSPANPTVDETVSYGAGTLVMKEQVASRIQRIHTKVLVRIQ